MEQDRKRHAAIRLGREIIGRCLRGAAYLRQHQLADGVSGQSASDQLAKWFQKDVDKRLGGVLRETLNCIARLEEGPELPEVDQQIERLRLQIRELNSIQKRGVNWLRNPAPPVELARFSRIIGRQIFHVFGDKVERRAVSVTPIDELCEALLAPAADGETDKIFQQLRDPREFKTFLDYLLYSQKFVLDCPLGVPRFDALNPQRWAALMHEIAHGLCGNQLLARLVLERELLADLSDPEKAVIEEARKLFLLDRWLLECWCDLFGAIAFGPAFWRAQSTAFLCELARNPAPETQKLYPSPFFRLCLIWEIISRRFPSEVVGALDEDQRALLDIYEVLDGVCDGPSLGNPLVREVYQLFVQFFLKHFLAAKTESGQDGAPLQQSYKTMMKYLTSSGVATINHIIQEFAAGIPVPTIRSDPKSTNETPAIIQELLIAAWHVSTALEKRLCTQLVKKAQTEPTLLEGGVLKAADDGIAKEYDRLDAAVLRSIQISEWVHHLELGGIEPSAREKLKDRARSVKGSKSGKGLLVDYEIYELMAAQKLRVIPLVNVNTQLGSSSLDVRLGTTLEIAVPRQLTHLKDPIPDTFYSRKYELDLFESFFVMPGQFVLAHTMEYVILPPDIAGELEGRSSYARLGLEIHRSASFIDGGFAGCITLELFNASRQAIRLVPGFRIGQLRFFRTGVPVKSYREKLSAKYGSQLSHAASMQGKDEENLLVRKWLEESSRPA